MNHNGFNYFSASYNKEADLSLFCLFVRVEALCPSKQFFSQVRMFFPELNQY